MLQSKMYNNVVFITRAKENNSLESMICISKNRHAKGERIILYETSTQTHAQYRISPPPPPNIVYIFFLPNIPECLTKWKMI